MKWSAIVVSLFLLLPSTLTSQTYLNQAGSPSFSTVVPVDLGFINLANGNLHLEIPIASYPQRGAMPYSARLVYDSRIWEINDGTNWKPDNLQNSQGGWRFVTSVDPGTTGNISGVSHLCDDPGPPRHSYTQYFGFSWTSADGVTRNFAINTERDDFNCDNGGIPNGDALADDGSGFHMYVTNYTGISAIYAKDGTQVYPNFQDRNGNFFTGSGANVVDTLGRQPVTATTNGNLTTYSYLTTGGARSRRRRITLPRTLQTFRSASLHTTPATHPSRRQRSLMTKAA